MQPQLTRQQCLDIRAHIAASTDPAVVQARTDGNVAELQRLYNLAAAPAFIVWRTSVTAQEIMSNGFVWTAVDALTPGKARIWDWMTRYGSINPSKANIRQGLADCFGGGSPMQTAILPHLKRGASVVERLFVTGTGSDAVPGQLGVEGPITEVEMQRAWFDEPAA